MCSSALYELRKIIIGTWTKFKQIVCVFHCAISSVFLNEANVETYFLNNPEYASPDNWILFTGPECELYVATNR